MAQEIKEYYSDGRISQKAAEVLGPEIERLAEANGGGVNAMDILTEALKPESPFYHHITHDQEQAAEQWNLQECRNLLDSVKVRIVVREEVVRDGPIVVSWTPPGGPTAVTGASGREYNLRPYTLVNVLKANPDAAESALQDAVGYVRAARKRLETLQGVLLPKFPSVQKIMEGMEEFEREAA